LILSISLAFAVAPLPFVLLSLRAMVVNDQNKFQAIISHAKEYGFVFQSSEIYDGLSAVYDYGPWGSELKKNIREAWWNAMTRMHDNIVGIDAAIFMHPTTWKASGHVDNFSDPMIDNKDSKKRYRVDHLIEGVADALNKEGKTNEAEKLIDDMDALLAANDYAGLKQLIEDNKMKCSVKRNLQLDRCTSIQPDVFHPVGLSCRRCKRDLPEA